MTEGRGFYYPRPFLSEMVCRTCGDLFEIFTIFARYNKGLWK